MTVGEYKLDFYRRGFSISENIGKDLDTIEIYCSKRDTDGVIFHNNVPLPIEFYTNAQVYIDQLKTRVKAIDEQIIKRHDQNINRCTHNLFMFNNEKKCTECMGKFGSSINIQLTDN